MKKDLPLKELIRGLRAREESAYTQLVGRYRRPVSWRLQEKLGLLQGQAEDATIETFEDVALYKIDQYKGDGEGFAGWLLTIALNTAISQRRKMHGCVGQPLSPALQAPEKSALQVLVEADEGRDGAQPPRRIQALLDALAMLIPSDREILQLRHADGELTGKELAARLGITEDAAWVRYSRAKKRLERLLRNDPRIMRSADRPVFNGGESYAQTGK
jgi:RNA polymerase sigma-70 factor (ECF subfamily)